MKQAVHGSYYVFRMLRALALPVLQMLSGARLVPLRVLGHGVSNHFLPPAALGPQQLQVEAVAACNLNSYHLAPAALGPQVLRSRVFGLWVFELRALQAHSLDPRS